ncbi:SMP-30/gluconolactonase/LRE family protein [Pseudonocardia cypriaca]|nr:SMP-30/gluconolactonase/LRE family protein [Pseudonocardia cypriaca]
MRQKRNIPMRMSSSAAHVRVSSAVLGIALAAGTAFGAAACASAEPAASTGAPAPAGLIELAHVRVLAEFDESAGQNAESIALEPDGGAVIGMISARQVVRVRGDGGTEVLVTMPVPADGGGTTPVVGFPQVTGVARDQGGAVFFLYSAGRGGLTGIWRLAPGSTEPELIVPMPADTMPNALLIDQPGDRFLVTDSTGGRVWEAPLSGGEPSVWSADPTIAPSGFFGANGLKLHAGAVWVSNYDLGTIVRIPVEQSGAAGPAAVHATGLTGIDDFDFTGRGEEILAALNDTSELVGVAADGSHRVLLDGDDGLQGTTAVVVRGDSAFITNGALREGDRPALRVARLVGG